MKFMHINLSFTTFAATAASHMAEPDETFTALTPLVAADLDRVAGNGSVIDWGGATAPVGGSKPAD